MQIYALSIPNSQYIECCELKISYILLLFFLPPRSLISKSSVRKPVRSVFATYLHIIINSLGIERKKKVR
ncbi:hypothetical protein ACN38_g11041 [Penicillium nordicum]|uniref:Uncharacterized protein n=1 Tax=Penicillium nordicum TaxID=229535 RepID=A0A0N0RXP2_9EURO|nr:hypothetical protein ACN38_g11041 [Penicillium nordicum]